jgi:enamine deaminase RidA (YjgF/YER057c/UK114 family)
VRTWYYLDRILDWYPEFNAARTAAYGRLGLPARPGGEAPPPASTGISGRTSSGSACTLDLIAVAPAAGGPVRVEMLANPAQADPWRYGSSFSRGAVVRWPGAALVEVSGAAAIDASGASVHRGDVARQAAHTLDAIAALLQRRGGVLPDLAAATAFVKRAEDAAEFRRVLAGRGITDLPAVCVVADVCREELLFELDGEALVPTSR